jgi:hypothetical protein
VLYSIDITFRSGGIACFGIESDQSDTYITQCAPIAFKTAKKYNFDVRGTISTYLNWGAKVQKLTPQGWLPV